MASKAGIDPFFTREGLEHTGAMYVAGQDPHQPMLSPAIRADLTGFLRYFAGGHNEILLDDSTRMATRAGAGWTSSWTSPLTFHILPGVRGVLDEADEALERAALFLRQHIRTKGTAHTLAS